MHGPKLSHRRQEVQLVPLKHWHPGQKRNGKDRQERRYQRRILPGEQARTQKSQTEYYQSAAHPEQSEVERLAYGVRPVDEGRKRRDQDQRQGSNHEEFQHPDSDL